MGKGMEGTAVQTPTSTYPSNSSNVPRPTSVAEPRKPNSPVPTRAIFAAPKPPPLPPTTNSTPKPPRPASVGQSASRSNPTLAQNSKESFGTKIRRLTIRRDARKNAPVRGCICYLGEKDKNGVCNGCDKRIGPYVVIKKIGEGSFSKVQLAYHVITRKKFALKLVNKQNVKDLEEVTQQINNEVNLLKGITGKARDLYVKIEEFFETENLFCLVMEFCEGGDLFSRVSTSNYLREEDAREYFVQIVLAVKTLHELGICHRDLKLENFLLDGYDRIKLADFGLSKAFVVNGQSADLLSTYCGTTDYAAPEVLRNQPYDGRLTDIWSIGVVLFAMLSGCFPFKNVNNQMAGMYSFPPSMSLEVRELIGRILVVNPKSRMSLERILQHPWCAKSKFLNQPAPIPLAPKMMTPNDQQQKSAGPARLSIPAQLSPAPSPPPVASSSNGKGKPSSYPASPATSPTSSPKISSLSFETSTLSSSSSSASSSRPRSASTPLPVSSESLVATTPSGVPPPPPPPPMAKIKIPFTNFTSFVSNAHDSTQRFFHQRFRSDEGLY